MHAQEIRLIDNYNYKEDRFHTCENKFPQRSKTDRDDAGCQIVSQEYGEIAIVAALLFIVFLRFLEVSVYCITDIKRRICKNSNIEKNQLSRKRSNQLLLWLGATEIGKNHDKK